ncbi:hypothetical protein PDTK01_36370 [Phycicoccus sp. DTK01]|nr:hypothetical protein PDTK01_36370 [Phycicoccus sp. DTK01]
MARLPSGSPQRSPHRWPRHAGCTVLHKGSENEREEVQMDSYKPPLLTVRDATAQLQMPESTLDL